MFQLSLDCDVNDIQPRKMGSMPRFATTLLRDISGNRLGVSHSFSEIKAATGLGIALIARDINGNRLGDRNHCQRYKRQQAWGSHSLLEI